MKKTLLSLALAGSLFVGGCVSNGPAPAPGDTNYPAYVQQLESDVKTHTSIAVGVYLYTNTEGEERVEVARFANDVARSIDKAVSEGLTLADLKSYASELVTKDINDEDRVLVGLLFNNISNVISNKLDIELKLDNLSERSRVGVRLVQVAANAVIEATDPLIKQNVQASDRTLSLPR